jgi:predicted ribosomally synthesized peptide with SipW-like signal peptide
MKKKVLSVALVAAMVAIMVSGTLAYFTARDDVTNTFTVGSVEIEIYENGEATESDTIEFKQPLIPVVNTADPGADESYIPKVVEVKNTGINEAFIRTHIAIPAALVEYLQLDLDTDGWSRQLDSAATVEGVDYVVYTYNYDTEVASGAFTSRLLKGVYLGSRVDLEEDANGDLYFVLKENGEVVHRSGFLAHTKNDNGTYASTVVRVLVASQAIQSRGFGGSTPSEALNTGFGGNPWQ